MSRRNVELCALQRKFAAFGSSCIFTSAVVIGVSERGSSPRDTRESFGCHPSIAWTGQGTFLIGQPSTSGHEILELMSGALLCEWVTGGKLRTDAPTGSPFSSTMIGVGRSTISTDVTSSGKSQSTASRSPLSLLIFQPTLTSHYHCVIKLKLEGKEVRSVEEQVCAEAQGGMNCNRMSKTVFCILLSVLTAGTNDVS